MMVSSGWGSWPEANWMIFCDVCKNWDTPVQGLCPFWPCDPRNFNNGDGKREKKKKALSAQSAGTALLPAWHTADTLLCNVRDGTLPTLCPSTLDLYWVTATLSGPLRIHEGAAECNLTGQQCRPWRMQSLSWGGGNNLLSWGCSVWAALYCHLVV